MGLFGIIPREDTEVKRIEQVYIEKYNKKLERYSKSLEHFDGIAKRLEEMIGDYELKNHKQEINNVEIVLDLKYLKEQGDLMSEQLLEVSQVRLCELKNQIDTGCSFLEEMNQGMEKEKETRIDLLRKIRTNNRLLKTSLFTQMILLIAIVMMLLNMLGIIVF